MTGSRFVELSHVISAGMTTYPGLPGPEVSAHLTREAAREHYAPGVTFAIDYIRMLGNTGTYLDSPYHRYSEGLDLAGLPLSALAELPAVVIHVAGSGRRAVDVDQLIKRHVQGCAVLLHTGSDRLFGRTDYVEQSAYLTETAAQWLVEQGSRLVGIDSANIDDVQDLNRPAHSVLLAAGIPIVEHLTGLEQLPDEGARFTAAPPRVRDFGNFPVRAYAVLPHES